ncbi:hypothetical protein D3Z39_08560 [Anaerotruncus colihominis]|uniref:Uncharacterized protein n=1 Tax=Anaerotruncus colihominis TaxID=169435 RepID=A0A845RH85_9FIRM|nr:hypothetical protein [Anaerotruncus colihominis]
MGRSPHKKRGPQAARACSGAGPSASRKRDRRRAAGALLASGSFPPPAFLKKGPRFFEKKLGKKLHTFFEKKVCQKTLAGCAANSGAGAAYQGPRRGMGNKL